VGYYYATSKYNSMTEIKESANMKEEEHLKEVLSNVEREEPIAPESIDTTKPSNSNINSQLPQQKLSSSTITADGSPQSLEEQLHSEDRKKKKYWMSLEANKNRLQKEVEDNKEKEYEMKAAAAGEDCSVSTLPNYTSSSWLDVAKVWTNLYVQSAKDAAKMTEYWLDLFSKPWL
jgi:hypothetical protein